MRRGQFGLPADYFRRNYISYVEGFGDPRAEFWLGLERIRALTGAGWQFLNHFEPYMVGFNICTSFWVIFDNVFAVSF